MKNTFDKPLHFYTTRACLVALIWAETPLPPLLNRRLVALIPICRPGINNRVSHLHILVSAELCQHNQRGERGVVLVSRFRRLQGEEGIWPKLPSAAVAKLHLVNRRRSNLVGTVPARITVHSRLSSSFQFRLLRTTFIRVCRILDFFGSIW